MLHLKEFKDKELLTAFKTRMDELSYGKDSKLVTLLKSFEDYADNKKHVVEKLAENASTKTQNNILNSAIKDEIIDKKNLIKKLEEDLKLEPENRKLNKFFVYKIP